MTNTTKTILILVGLGTAGFLTYKVIKKRKETKALEESQSADAGYTTTISDPRVYRGITDEQTKALQQMLNRFYQTGSLSGWQDWLSNQWQSAKNFAKSTISNTQALITGKKEGLEDFKAKVASIMPLQEDGIYGKNTMAAVVALQEFLNKNGASLTVDGKFGKNTQKAAGWNILAGLSRSSAQAMPQGKVLPMCGLI